jgi:CRP/FNR family transcriptional regulator, cyclic AMP receptor protein
MNAHYGLEIIDSCLDCKLRKGFCDFPADVLRDLDRISHQQTYPPGTSLFMEGQTGRGAFILCSGRVKLSTTSREGKIFILRIATPGEVLGMSAAVSQVPYEATAITASPCRVSFVHRDALLQFLSKHGKAGLQAARTISKEYQDACEEIQEILMAPSSTGKIAKLLLSWTTAQGSTDREFRVRSILTHEEMAQMIGSSRETVTRVLGDLKKKELIRLEGSTLVIRNRSGLEDLAS